MMGMREKLIELARACVHEFFKPGNAVIDYEEFLADHLIDNGVTIKKYEEIDFDYAAED